MFSKPSATALKIYNIIFMKNKKNCGKILEPDEKNYITYRNKNNKIVRITVKKYKETFNLS